MLFRLRPLVFAFFDIYLSIQRKNEDNFVAYFQISILDIFKCLKLMLEILCFVRFVYEVRLQKICRLPLVGIPAEGQLQWPCPPFSLPM